MQNNPDSAFNELIQLCDILRSKKGCLWDREQTHETLIPYLKEEAEEVIESINNGKKSDLKEELGDLLYQIVFHAQIASENKDFTITDVITGLISKLKRRHPHVFAGKKVSSVDEIIQNWKKIKKNEQKLKESPEE